MASVELISVGVDIGTTTTQIVISKLLVAETATLSSMPQARYGPARKPRADVAKKDVLYQSPVHFTPIDPNGLVDVDELEKILTADYKEAGFTPDQIDTGAVIITGEAAKSQNAERVLNIVAPLAGDFVSTVAGPSLEAHLAGRGSGAAAWSSEHFTWATNVDVGGGTTNIAVFRQGDLVDTVVLSVGGRHIQVDQATGTVKHITKSGEKMLNHLGIELKVGDVATVDVLRKVAHLMVDLIVDVLSANVSQMARDLMETTPLSRSVAGTTIFFSGGVADFYYDSNPIRTIQDVAVYGDIGPLMGEELRNHPRVKEWTVLKPVHTERATVMGASHETITLSGMTIWVAPKELPMRNVPVIRPIFDGIPDEQVLEKSIMDGYNRWDLDPTKDRVALALDLLAVGSYDDLKKLAHGIESFATKYISPSIPLILVTERDLGKALGQVVSAGLPQFKVLSIDEVTLTEGDYIDIGQSMLGDRLVSLSVKTLIFSM
ncbi:MAG: ethanolamine ammonia-lyase reactivating factor EutA [Candidatus Cryosericum sp.]